MAEGAAAGSTAEWAVVGSAVEWAVVGSAVEWAAVSEVGDFGAEPGDSAAEIGAGIGSFSASAVRVGGDGAIPITRTHTTVIPITVIILTQAIILTAVIIRTQLLHTPITGLGTRTANPRFPARKPTARLSIRSS